MSSRIERQEIISEEGLKAFKILFDDLMRIIGKAEELKSVLKDATSLNQVADAIKKTSKNTDDLTASQKELDRQTKALVKEKAKLANINSKTNKQLIETQEKTRAATKAMREQARAQLGLKKSGTGLIGMFKNLIRSTLAYGAAMLGLQQIARLFTSVIFKLTKKLDSLHFSMRTVIEDQKEQATTTIFLAKTAVNYGQDILTLTERYIKFRAAAQQSNMSARETMQIFDSTAKAAAVLGLRTDEVNGVFLALEQMISKGKVTTEELRRQLGERLPGAFGIMAKAMGVSIVDFDKMLKKGEILSTEALPKFAVALEKAYGIEAVTKVNTLAAAHGRLRTSWVQFVEDLEASQVYITILDSATKFINALNKAGKIELIDEQSVENIGKIIKEVSKLNKEEERGLFLRNKILDIQKEQIFQEEQLKKDEEKLNNIRFKWGRAREKQMLEGIINQRKTQINAAGRAVSEIRKIYNSLVIEEKLIEPFDVDKYIKDLNAAKKGTESFANVADKTLQGFLIKTTPLMKENLISYKSILISENKRLETAEALARIELDKSIGLKIEDAAAIKLNNIMSARIELVNRLAEIEKGPDDRLAIAKANNQKILALREKQFKFGENTRTVELQKEVELLKIKKKLNDNLIQFTEAGSKERAKVEADSQKIQTEITQTEAKRRAEIDKMFNEQRLQFSEDFKNERIAQIYELSDIEIIEISKRANREFLNSKKTTKDKIKAKWRETLEILKIKKKEIDEILKIDTLSPDERIEFEKELTRLRIILAQKGLDSEKNINAERIEDIKAKADDARAILSAGFDFSAALNNRALENAKRRFELETALAGENKFKQFQAEKKFEREQAKIKKRQAIANKAAAAAEIIINTAVAVTTTTRQTGLFGIPLIPLILAIGALQLATVLATKIPEFKKGGKHKGGPAKMSEKGPELFFPASGGNSVLTPATETIANMPAGEFKPADETQRILANQAYNQTYDMVDMSQTNSHLKRIDRNTSESIEESNGYKIVRKKGFRGKYRIA